VVVADANLDRCRGVIILQHSSDGCRGLLDILHVFSVYVNVCYMRPSARAVFEFVRSFGECSIVAFECGPVTRLRMPSFVVVNGSGERRKGRFAVDPSRDSSHVYYLDRYR
jgi:hypothetical protein